MAHIDQTARLKAVKAAQKHDPPTLTRAAAVLHTHRIEHGVQAVLLANARKNFHPKSPVFIYPKNRNKNLVDVMMAVYYIKKKLGFGAAAFVENALVSAAPAPVLAVPAIVAQEP